MRFKRTTSFMIASFAMAMSATAFGQQGDAPNVDFSYAFAVPHRISVEIVGGNVVEIFGNEDLERRRQTAVLHFIALQSDQNLGRRDRHVFRALLGEKLFKRRLQDRQQDFSHTIFIRRPGFIEIGLRNIQL